MRDQEPTAEPPRRIRWSLKALLLAVTGCALLFATFSWNRSLVPGLVLLTIDLAALLVAGSVVTWGRPHVRESIGAAAYLVMLPLVLRWMPVWLPGTNLSEVIYTVARPAYIMLPAAVFEWQALATAGTSPSDELRVRHAAQWSLFPPLALGTFQAVALQFVDDPTRVRDAVSRLQPVAATLFALPWALAWRAQITQRHPTQASRIDTVGKWLLLASVATIPLLIGGAMFAAWLDGSRVSWLLAVIILAFTWWIPPTLLLIALAIQIWRHRFYGWLNWAVCLLYALPVAWILGALVIDDLRGP
ncbi:MAG: hypothetical protein K2Y37_13545 [Pirellulales bacterium]|nr:hypothetical protein [Pirellulales bacterium]